MNLTSLRITLKDDIVYATYNKVVGGGGVSFSKGLQILFDCPEGSAGAREIFFLEISCYSISTMKDPYRTGFLS